MSTFPKFSTSTTDAVSGKKRSLQLQDCAPGDLVYLATDNDSTLFLVARDAGKSGQNALIGFGTDGPYYSLPYHDQEVLRFDQRPIFVLDQRSRRVASESSPIGTIQATRNGTYLLIKNPRNGASIPYDLGTFDLGRVGHGIEFPHWSIEIADDLQRRMALYEHIA